MKSLMVKILILLMFISGFFQWDFLNLQWENLSFISVFHLLLSLFVSVFLLIPFVNQHTYKYIVVKRVNSLNGWLLGFTLLIITISGFYLFIVGNRGGDIIGTLSYNIHLYGSFFLIILFFYHVKPSAEKRKNLIAILGMLFIFSNPVKSFSETQFAFTSLKLEDNTSRYHVEDWTNSTKCKSCHSEIFDQWADSNHKNLVESNPYYMVMEALAGEDIGEDFRAWCMGCHNPSALSTNQTRTTHSMDENFLVNMLHEKGAKTLIDNYKKHGDTRLEDGVSCVTCHRITEASSVGDASYKVELKNRKKYPFEDSESSLSDWMSEKFINSKPKVHKESYMKPLYKEAKYCASCHDETSPITDKRVVSTFKEWEKSPYNNLSNPKEHKSCIDCHMTYLEDGKFSPQKGVSTDGGVIKKDIKVHYFSGSNHFLSGLKSKEHEDQTIQLLKTSAKLDVDIANNEIIIGVKNEGAGHHLPTGVADFRELWLEVVVSDGQDNIVFSSGQLDNSGNLKEDARVFMKVFGDENYKPVGLKFWRYKTLLKDTRIPAKERREERYNINTNNFSYPLTLSVKLNFRIYPQWVTDIVKRAYPALPNPPVIELEKIIKKFDK